jgi:N-acetylmuramate 1-kinase
MLGGADQGLSIDTVQPLLQEWFPQSCRAPTLTPLVADASTRRYFRIEWPEPVRAPRTCILMSCEPWLAHDMPDFLTVARHLRASGVHVPCVYGIAPAQGLMCLEDFGDTTLAAAWQTATTATCLQWGRRAVDELVQMHTVGTQRRDPACPAFHLAFDVPKLHSELQFFRQHAIEGLWHQSLTAAERQAFDAACMPLCALLAAQPRYFCHRDYHGWNIMAHAGSVGVLDFQDARLGPQPYDLVSLLVDRGTPEVLGQEGLTALTTYYIQRMEADEGRRLDRQTFAELSAYVAVQRCLKAIGTFAYMHVGRGRPQYLPYIPPTLTYIKPLVSRYEILKELTALLRRYVPLWQE